MRLLTKSDRKPGAGAQDLAAATQAIGERYETIHANLDGLSKLIAHLRAMEPLVEDIRRPLGEEFEVRRREHAELTSLRIAHEAARRQLSDLQASEQGLTARLATAESALADVEASAQARAVALEENALELDRLRNQVRQADLRISGLESSQRDALTRAEHLDQDCAELRAKAQDSANLRAAAEAAAVHARQEASLAAEESAAMRKRLEAAVAEAARLGRLQAELESGLAGERARAQTDQAETARAMRALEAQLESARSEAAGLQARVETAGVRADRLEDLNTQLSQRLAETTAQQHGADRRACDLQLALERAVERTGVLEDEAAQLRQKHADLETARAAAVERADQLAKTAQTHEKALKRGEDRSLQLRARFTALQAAHEEIGREHAAQVAALKAEIERIEAEATLSAGALESARRDRSRLQSVVLGAGGREAAAG